MSLTNEEKIEIREGVRSISERLLALTESAETLTGELSDLTSRLPETLNKLNASIKPIAQGIMAQGGSLVHARYHEGSRSSVCGSIGHGWRSPVSTVERVTCKNCLKALRHAGAEGYTTEVTP